MVDYTVKKIYDNGVKDGKYGEYQIYTLFLNGVEGKVTYFGKPAEMDSVQEGDSLSGYVLDDAGEYEGKKQYKLRKAKPEDIEREGMKEMLEKVLANQAKMMKILGADEVADEPKEEVKEEDFDFLDE